MLKDIIRVNKTATSIANRIKIDILESRDNHPHLKPKTLKDFSKWCHTGGPYSCDYEHDKKKYKENAQEIAIDISRLLFGEIIPRMDGDKYHK